MSFDRTRDAGFWWGRAQGKTSALAALLRFMTNRNVAGLAAIVTKAHEIAAPACAVADVRRAYDILRGLPPGVVSRLARHPSFSYWVSTTTHLLRVHAGFEPLSRDLAFEGTSDRQLELHFADLHRFAIAGQVAVLDVVSEVFTPVHAGSLVLPTTGLVIDGVRSSVPLRVEANPVGRSRIEIRVEQGDRELIVITDQPWALREDAEIEVCEARGMRLLAMPRVRGTGPGFEIDRWDPYAVNAWVRHETFPGNIRALLDSEERLPAWATTLRAAMGLLMTCWPEMEAELSSLVGSIVPVAAPDDSKNLSVTAPEFWGSFLCSLDPAPMMGEVIVHEYRHNLLNALTAAAPVFCDDSPAGAEFYSPWRDDPRPLAGLLHAMFTFSAVVGFYRRYLERAEANARNRRAATRRAKAHALRLAIVVRQFGSARLTPFGEGLFAGISNEIEDLTTFADTLRGPEVEDIVAAVAAHAARAGVSLTP